MSDIQELVGQWCVSREAVRQFIWYCVEEKIISPPERGRWNNLVLSKKDKQILSQMWDRRRQEVSTIASLAEEFHITHEAVRKMLWDLVKKGIISQPKKEKEMILLSVSQTIAFREYRRKIKKESPVTSLAREIGYSTRQMREKVHQLAEEGKIPPLKKKRRGRRTELVFDPKKVKEELTKGAE